MISCNDFKKGMTILFNSELYEIVEFQHTKVAMSNAFVRTKLRNLNNNVIIEYTFRGREQIEHALIEKKALEYLYRDKEMFYFMDTETYEQIAVEGEKILPHLGYVKENELMHFSFYNGKVIEAKPPDFVIIKVVEAQPGVRGDTAQGGSKPVTLETGKVLQAPLFVNEGDRIKIDTRSGTYVERVKQ